MAGINTCPPLITIKAKIDLKPEITSAKKESWFDYGLIGGST